MVLASAAAVLVGCASNRRAQPNFYNGHYFMTGDAQCAFARPLTPTRIMCANEDKEETGYRDAMTMEDMQMYQQVSEAQRLREQLEMQQLNASLQQLGQVGRNAQEMGQRQMQYYTPPAVSPVVPPGGNRTVCLVNGNYVYCDSTSPGGNTETTCTRIGNQVICR